MPIIVPYLNLSKEKRISNATILKPYFCMTDFEKKLTISLPNHQNVLLLKGYNRVQERNCLLISNHINNNNYNND